MINMKKCSYRKAVERFIAAFMCTVFVLGIIFYPKFYLHFYFANF